MNRFETSPCRRPIGATLVSAVLTSAIALACGPVPGDDEPIEDIPQTRIDGSDAGVQANVPRGDDEKPRRTLADAGGPSEPEMANVVKEPDLSAVTAAGRGQSTHLSGSFVAGRLDRAPSGISTGNRYRLSIQPLR